MSKQQERIEKRRRIRAEQKRKKLKAKEPDEIIEEDELDDELDLAHIDDDEEDEYEVTEEDVPPEQKEKEMAMAAPMTMPGPTTWDEKEAMDEAHEKASELREVGWDVQDLVYNIIAHPELTPSDKAKAMKEVADGFEERVSSIMATGEEDTEKELDLLSVQAIQAYDKRHTGILENVADIITKAKLTAKRENALSDEQFALVRNEGGVKVRKYPIHDKAHVRNALARAAQMINRGGSAAKDARAALPKIRAAAKRMGIGESAKKESNAIMVEKDANGNWRWVGLVSNNFVDWDGDIFSEEAHKEYVEWLDKNMDVAPSFVTWHTPGTVRESSVDFATYEKGFLIVSGKLNEQEAAALLKAKTETEIGLSHGTFVFARDPKDPRIVTKYRMYEVSDLPLDRAANPFTAFETITKEVGMDKLQYLAAILGSEEKAKSFLEKTGMKQKELQEAGVESKEKTEATPEPVAEQKTAPVQDIQALVKELGLDELSEWVAKAKEDLEKIPLLEAALKELSTTKEEKVAEMISPPAAPRLSWMTEIRKENSEKNIVKEDDPLKDAKPGLSGGWLSEVTQTTPMEVNIK